MRKGRTGKPQSEEARAKMSRAHRQRGTLVPGTDTWTVGEDEAVRTLRPADAAKGEGHKHAQALKALGRVEWFADPSGAGEIEGFRLAGLNVRPAENAIRPGCSTAAPARRPPAAGRPRGPGR